MRVIKTYIADDGKKFDSECECMLYEEELRSNKFADSAFLFDQDGKKLPLTDNGFEKAFFIICKTEEAADYLYEEFGRMWESPWSKTGNVVRGAWIYFNEEWISADELLGASNLMQQLLQESEM